MSVLAPNVRPEFQQAYDHWMVVEDICRAGAEGEPLDEAERRYDAFMAVPALTATEVAMKLYAARIYTADDDVPDEYLAAIEAELRALDRAATSREQREYETALLGIEELATMIEVLDHSQLFDHTEHHADILLGATMFGYIAKRAKTLFAAISGDEVSA